MKHMWKRLLLLSGLTFALPLVANAQPLWDYCEEGATYGQCESALIEKLANNGYQYSSLDLNEDSADFANELGITEEELNAIFGDGGGGGQHSPQPR